VPAMTPPHHIVLIGLMASGKSTVGRGLAARLGLDFCDNDELLVRRTGRAAREIEAAEGIDALHRAEAAALIAALAGSRPAVIDAAAGAVPAPGVESALAGHDVVYLRASPDVLQRRIEREADDGHRPFVTTTDLAQVLRQQFDARDALYHRLATIEVDADRTPDELIDAISSQVARTRPRR